MAWGCSEGGRWETSTWCRERGRSLGGVVLEPVPVGLTGEAHAQGVVVLAQQAQGVLQHLGGEGLADLQEEGLVEVVRGR